MQFRFCRFAGLLCLAATLQVNRGLAQEPPKSAGTPAAAQPGDRGRVPGPYVIEIRDGAMWENGKPKNPASLANVVDELRKLWPEANIVLAPEVSGLKIEDLKLRSIHELWEALEAVRVASGYRFEWRKGSPSVPVADPATGLLLKAAPVETSLFILDRGTESQRNSLERARHMVEVFNLKDYLRTLATHPAGPPGQAAADPSRALHDIEQIVMDTVYAMGDRDVPESDQPKFMFHESAGVLVVTGPPDMIEVAHKVISALTGSSGPEFPAARGQAPDFYSRFGMRMPRTSSAESPAEPLTPEQEARQRYLRYGPRQTPPAQAQPGLPGAAGDAPATPAAPGQAPH